MILLRVMFFFNFYDFISEVAFVQCLDPAVMQLFHVCGDGSEFALVHGDAMFGLSALELV